MQANTISKGQTYANIRAFIAQRPGFDWRNYGDASSYRADMRHATQQLHDARKMLDFIQYNGLQFHVDTSSRFTVDQHGAADYTTGQYWCTEFRAGACRYLASVIWRHWREFPAMSADKIRIEARATFGRGIASRYFN